MNKILYYSLVDWDWIKQRPQFIALGLAENACEVHVVYIYQYHRKGLSRIDSGKVHLRPIYRIPALGYRFSLINKINRWIVRQKVEQEIRQFQPDVIWLTHPSQIVDIPDDFSGRIVYDCMDDYDVLGAQPSNREHICTLEQKLCRRSDLIFVSSSVLQEKICARNPDKADQVHLLRNGYNGKLYPRATAIHGDKLYAGYVGTIAEWFDFDLVLESLERIPQLEYFLIGPVTMNNLPEHARIHFMGTVPHDSLYDAIKEMDFMVMPFQLNDIVLAVDPVKLYEYISWKKNIVTVSYPEIDRFKAFVWQYNNADEYCAVLNQVGKLKSISYSEAAAANFLANNAWKNRVDIIMQKLQELKQ